MTQKFIGATDLYLQFKTPYIHEKWYRAPINNLNQLQLMRKYPHNSSYYVTHSFSSISEIQEAQQNCTPTEFLDYYVAIESHCFEWELERITTTGFKYEIYPLERNTGWVRGHTPRTLQTGRQETIVEGVAKVLTGSELLEFFLNHTIGCRVKFGNDFDAPWGSYATDDYITQGVDLRKSSTLGAIPLQPEFYIDRSSDIFKERLNKFKESDFGLILRQYDETS